MRLRDPEKPIDDEMLGLITGFTTALEKELCSYAFNLLVDVEALVRYAELDSGAQLPDFPKLCARISWPGPDQCMHHFEASIPLRELELLSEETEEKQGVYFYHLARMMLSSLALARVMNTEEKAEL